MGNQFYEPGVQRAEKVRALFARVAKRYDLLNDLQSFGLHRYWKRRVLQLAGVRKGSRALDLCCGTGDIALGLAEAGAEVVGLDFSAEMLAVAERRKNAHAYFQSKAQLSFLQGDALRIPFPESSFDIITVGYGLRNLSDWRAGLIEMRRVGKNGARLVVLEFGKPNQPVWRGIYFGYLKCFVPVLGLLFCRSASAYSYILESLKHYPAQEGVAAEMQELGLANVRIYSFLGGVMTINYGEKPQAEGQ